MSRIKPNWVKIIILFVSYVLFAAVFAGIYEDLYKQDQKNFHFTAEITTAQLNEQTRNIQYIQSSIQEFEKDRDHLAKRKEAREFLMATSSFPLERDPKYGWLIGQFGVGEVIFRFQFDSESQGLQQQFAILQVFTRKSRELFVKEVNATRFVSNGYYISKLEVATPQVALNVLNALERDFQLEVERIDKNIQSLKQEEERLTIGPQWNFTDFFYFSVTSIVGGGYGDIVPNSSQVRMVVVVQFLISVLIIGFLVAGFMISA